VLIRGYVGEINGPKVGGGLVVDHEVAARLLWLIWDALDPQLPKGCESHVLGSGLVIPISIGVEESRRLPRLAGVGGLSSAFWGGGM
jgi:hypothetical protein